MRASASQLWPEVAPDWILNGPDWLNSLGYDIYKSFVFDGRDLLLTHGFCGVVGYIVIRFAGHDDIIARRVEHIAQLQGNGQIYIFFDRSVRRSRAAVHAAVTCINDNSHCAKRI